MRLVVRGTSNDLCSTADNLAGCKSMCPAFFVCLRPFPAIGAAPATTERSEGDHTGNELVLKEVRDASRRESEGVRRDAMNRALTRSPQEWGIKGVERGL